MKSFFAKLQQIDRRVLYVLMAIVVFYATIKPMGLPISVGQETKSGYDFVEALPAGSPVVLMFNFDASSSPELLPAAVAMMHHMLDRNLRVIGLGMWNQAGSMASLAWNEVQKQCPDKVYGTDFVNIGFRTGQIVWEGQAVTDFAAACGTSDFSGAPLAGMPVLQGVNTIKDTVLWVDLGSGTPGYAETIATVGIAGVPIITGVTAVSVAGALPFYQSGQLKGLIMGMRGAAEYELLAGAPGKAIAGMDAQSLSHVLLIVFIILGNIGYLASRKPKQA